MNILLRGLPFFKTSFCRFWNEFQGFYFHFSSVPNARYHFPLCRSLTGLRAFPLISILLLPQSLPTGCSFSFACSHLFCCFFKKIVIKYACYRLNRIPSNLYIEALSSTLVPQNVTVFGDRVFKKVI